MVTRRVTDQVGIKQELPVQSVGPAEPVRGGARDAVQRSRGTQRRENKPLLLPALHCQQKSHKGWESSLCSKMVFKKATLCKSRQLSPNCQLATAGWGRKAKERNQHGLQGCLVETEVTRVRVRAGRWASSQFGHAVDFLRGHLVIRAPVTGWWSRLDFKSVPGAFVLLTNVCFSYKLQPALKGNASF